MTWSGYDRHFHRVRAGTYHWRFSVTDAAGNTRRTATYPVIVSSKRLVRTTVRVSRRGSSAKSAGGSARCAYARRRSSHYAHGLRLSNGCSAQGYDLASADYTFTLPRAIRYRSLKLRTYGYSQQRPSELTSTVERTDGGFGVSDYVRVSRRGARWYTLTTSPPAVSITAQRRVRATIILDSTYPRRNDFDIASMQVVVSMYVLR